MKYVVRGLDGGHAFPQGTIVTKQTPVDGQRAIIDKWAGLGLPHVVVTGFVERGGKPTPIVQIVREDDLRELP